MSFRFGYRKLISIVPSRRILSYFDKTNGYDAILQNPSIKKLFGDLEDAKKNGKTYKDMITSCMTDPSIAQLVEDALQDPDVKKQVDDMMNNQELRQEVMDRIETTLNDHKKE